ncbi:MAG: hypothetical protein AAFZ52_13500, partial [Bacteroidota bacterium]
AAYVATECPAHGNEVVDLKAHLNDLQNKVDSGTLFAQNIPTHFARHRQAVLDFIGRLESKASDYEEPEAVGVAAFHCYTVNREDQIEELSAHKSKGNNCQFFLLYGDDRHEHEHFYERVAHDLQGHFRDVDNPNLLNDYVVERLSPYAVRFRDNPDDYRKELLKKLYDKAGLDANAHAPLLDKSLDYFREQAPRTAALGPGDYVTIFFRLEDLDEAPDKAAKTVSWFIDYVTTTPLPPESPNFLFFFSFEFDEGYPDEAEEVRGAVKQIPRACVIKEFNKVVSRDVVKWLKRYRKIIPNAQHPRVFGESLFARDGTFFMADINPKLQQLINDYNESL